MMAATAIARENDLADVTVPYFAFTYAGISTVPEAKTNKGRMLDGAKKLCIHRH